MVKLHTALKLNSPNLIEKEIQQRRNVAEETTSREEFFKMSYEANTLQEYLRTVQENTARRAQGLIFSMCDKDRNKFIRDMFIMVRELERKARKNPYKSILEDRLRKTELISQAYDQETRELSFPD